MAIYNVKNYGAAGNGTTLDNVAIQKAIDAAWKAGGGDVYIPTGTYALNNSGDKSDGCIIVKDNVNIYGDGMGKTILQVKAGWSGAITGVVRSEFEKATSNYSVKNLTIDGNRAATDGKVDGFYTGFAPGQTGQDTNVMIDSVEVKNCEGYGFDPHERTQFLTIQNSVSHGNGLDGFVADYIINGTYKNNIAYGNDRHGFNVTTSTHDLALTGNKAYDNGSAGIVIQRGSEDIAVPKNIQITGGEYYNNAKEGILLRMTDSVTISDANVHDNGTIGVRFYGASNSTLEDSIVHNNSQSKNAGYPEVRLEDEATTSKVFASLHNLIQNNQIVENEIIRATYGVEEKAGLTDYNTVTGNTISGVTKADPILISGAHSTEDGGGSSDQVNITGTDVGELITDNNADNNIMAKGGNDTVNASTGNDTIDGGSGNDSIHGGIGNDLINAGSDNDKAFGDAGNDTLNGSSGNDTLDGGADHDSIVGGTGTDSLLGGDGNDTVLGGDQNDTIDGGLGNDSLNGGTNDDSIVGGYGLDTIDGSTGNDTILGGNDNDSILGSAGADLLKGDNGNDTVSGGTENDTLYGGSGSDSLVGDDGDDQLYGEGSADVLFGGNNNDYLSGGDGNDTLYGGSGNDTLFGGSGSDSLVAGGGADILTGGLGTDRFVFATTGGEITDFDTLHEKIDITAFGVTAANLTFSKVNGDDTSVLITKGALTATILVDHTVVDAGDFIFS